MYTGRMKNYATEVKHDDGISMSIFRFNISGWVCMCVFMSQDIMWSSLSTACIKYFQRLRTIFFFSFLRLKLKAISLHCYVYISFPQTRKIRSILILGVFSSWIYSSVVYLHGTKKCGRRRNTSAPLTKSSQFMSSEKCLQLLCVWVVRVRRAIYALVRIYHFAWLENG